MAKLEWEKQTKRNLVGRAGRISVLQERHVENAKKAKNGKNGKSQQERARSKLDHDHSHLYKTKNNVKAWQPTYRLVKRGQRK